MGKTALLRRCLTEARDAVVLEASGDESEVELEYGVVAQLLAGAGTAPRGGGTFAVGADLLATFGALQEPDATLIVAVDDAHLMDRSSAGALLFALRRLQADRVAVLLVTRPAELDRLGPGWARLANDPERTV